jgi:hypothetical protein
MNIDIIHMTNIHILLEELITSRPLPPRARSKYPYKMGFFKPIFISSAELPEGPPGQSFQG